jgi:16S rRNA (cytidine1402-2'-O)-methyltransferase
VLYEAPHRIAECLADLVAACGAGRQACIARELTKRYESFYRGTLGELAARAASEPDLARGESVVVVAGAPPSEPGTAELDDMLEVLLRHLPPSAAAAAAASLAGVRRSDAYARALALTRASGE